MLQKKLGDKYKTSAIDSELKSNKWAAEERTNLKYCVGYIKSLGQAIREFERDIAHSLGDIKGATTEIQHDINRDMHVELKIAADELTTELVHFESTTYDRLIQSRVKKILPDDLAPISGEESSNDSKK